MHQHRFAPLLVRLLVRDRVPHQPPQPRHVLHLVRQPRLYVYIYIHMGVIAQARLQRDVTRR